MFKATETESAFEPLDAKEREQGQVVSRKARIVLEWLLMGGTLSYETKAGSYTVRMFERRICVETTAEKAGIVKPAIIGLEFSLESFLSECEKTSDEDISLIAANLGLNQSRRGR